MKLNPDCIRDILLWVESNTGYLKEIDIQKRKMVNGFEQYSVDEFFYHLKQCANYRFIEFQDRMSMFRIIDLTPSGHEFIANIRENNNWAKVKSASYKIGSVALPVLQALASDTIFSQINKIISG